MRGLGLLLGGLFLPMLAVGGTGLAPVAELSHETRAGSLQQVVPFSTFPQQRLPRVYGTDTTHAATYTERKREAATQQPKRTRRERSPKSGGAGLVTVLLVLGGILLVGGVGAFVWFLVAGKWVSLLYLAVAAVGFCLLLSVGFLLAGLRSRGR